MSKELRDRVAKAIAAVDGHKLGQMAPAITSLYFARADAAIALVRAEQAARLAQLEAALREIASYEEGPKVTRAFDEPIAARIARAALGEERT